MKVAVIGAGVAGMTTAYMLTKKNTPVDVFEAGSNIGGMAASFELWNQIVDIGPHRFFSSDKIVNDLWLEVVGSDYEMVNRLTRIFYNNQYYRYPIKIGATLKNLGAKEALHCIASYLSEKVVATKQDGSFEAWVKEKFGSRLYSIFFKTYSEKLWGIPCTELDADFAAQRIKKLSLYETLKNALLQGKNNKHKTLVDQFAYPKEGTGMVYRRMAQYVEEQGNNVYLNSPVYKVVSSDNRVLGIELQDGTFRRYDHVVSTMPYTLMVKRMSEVPAKIVDLTNQLTFRNTVIVYLHINDVNLFPDNWMYIHSKELQMGRITNFSNWVPQICNNQQKTILAIEYWCNADSAQWKADDRYFIELASAEMIQTGLVKAGAIEDGFVYRINRSYPVYTKGYKEIINPINEYLSSFANLSVIGRYGAFKYNNQDHSILMGIKASENILLQTKHDLFGINTDYETYQESSIISKSILSNA